MTTTITTAKVGGELPELRFNEGRGLGESRGSTGRTHDSDHSGRRTLEAEVAQRLGWTARGNT